MSIPPHVVWIHSQPEPYLNRMIDELARRSDFTYEAIFLRRNPVALEAPLPKVAQARYLSVPFGQEAKPPEPFLTTHPNWRQEIFENPPAPSRRPSAVIVAGYRSHTLRGVIRECRRLGIPTAIFADSNLRGERGHSLEMRIKRRLKRWALPSVARSVDRILVANRLGTAYWRYYGAPKDKIVVCPYYADYGLVEEARVMGRGAALGPFGLEGEQKLIVTAARLVPIKGLELMMRAFRSSGLGERGWTWAIAGSGPLEESLKREAGEALGKSVKFLGFVQPSQLLPLIAHAQLFVLPSLQEPHGIVVQEALAAGTPVVAAHTCGAAFDLVRPGVSGWIFRAGAADDLQVQLRAAAEADLGLMRAGAREAFERWLARFNPVEIVDRWAHEVI